MLRKFSSILLAVGIFCSTVFAQQRATEGMWMPLSIKDLNYADMQKLGFKLGKEGVYSTTEISLKDKVVRLNGGSCTAEVISGDGLLLTNHHCAYDAVASLSSVKNDFLTDGFWAKNHGEELPIPGGFVSFLVRMEDVTTQVLGADRKETDPGVIEERKEKLIKEANEGNDYSIEIKEMFNGSELYLFVYEDFNDIRMVGAPPSSIGKYGGDTDNWMWPRHTGDFSLIRVYADKDNKPAAYSKDNIPYHPKAFFPISLKGVRENDYAMIMGYPGSTDRYLTSSQINFALDQTNGDRVKLMGQKLETMKKYMDKNDTIRIGLASNYASLANYWKYLIGQTTMLKRYDVAGVKAAEERQFVIWANAEGTRKDKYGKVMEQMQDLHKGYNNVDKYVSYFQFAVLGPQASSIAASFMRLQNGLATAGGDKEKMKKMSEKTAEKVMEAYKEFYPSVDKELMYLSLWSFYKDIPADMQSPVFKAIWTSKVTKKGKTPEEKLRLWVNEAYKTSVATNQARAKAFFANPDPKVLEKDMLVSLIGDIFTSFREKVYPLYGAHEEQVGAILRTYEEGLREMHKDKKFYPDANSTMRVTYGKVSPYSPRDGVFYDYYTTLDGVIEKEDNTNEEFTVPKKLHDLWVRKDYGQYAMNNGKMPVCFLTTNDITGGNSGSPVLNADGELIGCAFDGNWEAMAGDIYVFPNLNRTIAVDIRYVLFLIDKYAGATHIINELDIRRPKTD